MRRYGIALTLSALAAFVPAGHAATGARLTAITATTGAAPAVLIEASEPVAYRTARPDPFTVLVDLPNVAAAGYANGFTARPDSPVTSVAVETTRDGDGRPVARIRVGLAEPISHRVRSQRNLIFVELAAEGEAAPAAVATPAAPKAVPAAGVSAIPANRAIEEVQLDAAGPDTSILLVGNGRIAPSHVERAGPKRLYLDFPNVLASAPPVTVINRGPVDRVRVALNSQKPLVTRVVVDLERPAMHLVESIGDGSAVKVSFREGAGGPPVAVPASQPAASRTEPARAEPAKAEPAPAPTPAPAPAAVPAPAPAGPAVAPSAAPLAAGKPAAQQTSAPEGKQYSGHPISLDFQGADLRAVLRTFAEISGLNIVIDPAVQGSVDVALRDVPWDQALDIILRANKLGYVVDGTIVRVAPLTVLADEEKQRRALAEQQALTGELRVMTRTLSYATADQVRPLLLKSALSQRGTIEVDSRTNTLIISDLQASLDKAAALIGTLDQPQPQVEIEARIVITNKAFRREIGAQLGLGGEMTPRLGNTTPLAFPNQVVGGGRTGGPTGDGRAPNAVDLGVQGATSAIGLALGAVNGAFNLDVALSALESEGKLSVISTPRVSTQNNVEAEIAQGTQIPIQTVANNTITVTFKDAALVLRVTPQITAANTVIMKIALENAQADFGRSVNGIPPIDTQRANTSVLVADGATTVIGGIYFSSQETRQGRTPVLHKVPLLGWLFKNDLTNNQNNELLIFITPRILKS